MAFAQSPYYTPQWGQAAGSLATALFGDPAARQKQQLTQAQMDEYQAATDRARAAAGYDRSRTAGQDNENDANSPGSLAHMFGQLYGQAPMVSPPFAPPPQNLLDPDDTIRTVPVPPSIVAPDTKLPQTPEQTFRSNLPEFMAGLVRGGHAKEADALVRAMAAFGGDDELARRGLVAGGNSPSKDFAITPQRADDIRNQGFNADYNKAIGIANVNAGASRYAADQSAGARRYAADRSLQGSQYGTDAHYGAPTSLADIITSMVPNARITSGNRSQAQQDRLIAQGATSAHNSYHVPGHGGEAIDMAPVPGMTLGEVVANLGREGYKVIESLNESGKGRDQGTGAHWHIAIATPPRSGAGKSKSTPKFSAASNKVLQDSVAQAMGAQPGTDPTTGHIIPAWNQLDMDGPSKQRLLSRAQELTMGGMAPAQAALQAAQEYTAAIKQNGGKLMTRKPGEPFRAYQPPAAAGEKIINRIPPHARRAPDGNLYTLGTDGKYYRIEER